VQSSEDSLSGTGEDLGQVGVKARDDGGRGEAERAMVRHEGRHSASAGDADGGGWGVE